MSKSLQDEADQFSDNTLARLNISVSKDGEVSFICDWSDDDNGLSSMAHILAIISQENLTEDIIHDLKSKSSSSKEIEEIAKIILYYTAINEVRKKLPEVNSDKVVISPIDAGSII